MPDYSTIPFFTANMTSPAVFRTPTFSISRCRIPSTDRGLRNISFPISAAVFSSQISINTSDALFYMWRDESCWFIIYNKKIPLKAGSK
jgi:hypothetical protein